MGIRSESRFLPTVNASWQTCLPEEPATPGEVCPSGQRLDRFWATSEPAGRPLGRRMNAGTSQLLDPCLALLEAHIWQALHPFPLPLQSRAGPVEEEA